MRCYKINELCRKNLMYSLTRIRAESTARILVQKAAKMTVKIKLGNARE